MRSVHAPQCSAGALHGQPVRPRLFKGFSLAADSAPRLLKQHCLLRHTQNRRVSTRSATETGVLESVDRSAGIIPQASAPEGQTQIGDWSAALQYLKEGSVHDLEVKFVNTGGVKGTLAGIETFVPYSKMYKGQGSGNLQQHLEQKLAATPGFKIKVKVVSADAETRKLVASERAVVMDAAVNRLKIGDVVTVVVNSLSSYGAFANIKDPQTGTFDGGNALLYISDMSWDHVAVPSDIVQVGDELQCKIKTLDKKRQRIGLSLKLMEEDPLRQTLDKLFSTELRDSVTEVPVNIPQGVKDICSELEKEDGIESVVLGRQAEERRVVSQDLELWISKEVLPDGFVLITRAGRTVQELRLTTKLPLDSMKSAVQRVLQRLT